MDSELTDNKEPEGEQAEGSEKEGLQGDGEDFAFHGFESGGIVRRPRSTLSNEAGATTGSVFDSDTSARFAPLAGFAQLPQGEQFAAGAAFAADFREPTVRAGAHAGNRCGNHPAIGQADEPLAGLRVAFDFVGFDFHYRDMMGHDFGTVKENFEIFFRRRKM